MSTTEAPVSRSGQVAKESPHRWPAAIRTLMIGTFLVRSLGFTYPFLPYRLEHLHLTTRTVSCVLAVFGGGWLLGSILCGWLADRIGHRATLLAAMLAASAALPLLAQAHSVPGLLAAAFTAGVVYDAPRPVFTAAIAVTFPEDRVRTSVNAWRNFAVNAGAAAAGTAGGLLAGPIGIPALIWANAAACALFALLVWYFMPPAQRDFDTNNRQPAGYRAALVDPRLWLLLVTSLCALTCAASLFSLMPMLMAEDGLAASDYGLTQTANAGAVLLLSPILNRWLVARADRPAPMTGLLAASSVVLGTTMGAAGFASTALGYSAAAALAVPGEVLAFGATADILNRISPASARGLYAGIWGTTLAVAVLIAPALGGWALTHGGDRLAAATTFGVGLLGAVLSWPLARIVLRARHERSAA
ncbi:MFS transporter [Streptomyces sp. bgisy153]|uniref:MFS transporter n=1 Tax=Streptomyces sp. bgisy153 TaxID=3413793 RepID=UPI003D72CEA1